MKTIRTFFCGSMLSAALLTISVAANASSYSVLHYFCTGISCGALPVFPGGLVRDSQGNLYGVAFEEGGNGDVYELINTSGGYVYQLVYAFCQQQSCADGNQPVGKLVVDTSGNLYGVTSSGGSRGYGTIFRLSPAQSGWSLTTLWNFCQDSCKGGMAPASGMTYVGAMSGATYDGLSPLFGTTQGGGKWDNGTVYQFNSPNNSPTLKALYSFCPTSSCATGASPSALIADANGNLFGTTFTGGAGTSTSCTDYRCGVVFEVSSTGNEQTLYSFCPNSQGQPCSDAYNPHGALAMDSNGNLYGGAGGGSNAYCGSGSTAPCGAIFRVVPNGINSAEAVYFNFCPEGGSCSTSGSFPQGDLLIDGFQITGTTTSGGANGAGEIFRTTGAAFAVLYNFCSQTNCLDGATPITSVIEDGSGNLYGATNTRGHGYGDVFEWKPSP